MSPRYNTRSRSGSGDGNAQILSIPSTPSPEILDAGISAVQHTPSGAVAEDEDLDRTEESQGIFDASLQPKLIGCGTQVSDSIVSQAINQYRTVSDLQTIPETNPDICPHCNVECSDSDEALCCNGCNGWFHCSCVNVSSSVYLQLQDSSLSWFCCSCYSSPASDDIWDRTQLTQFLEDLGGASSSQSLADDIVFGCLKGNDASKAIDKAYNVIVHWKPNVFLTPSGHAGQNFLTTIKNLFDQFTANGPLKPLALKLILIAGPLLLQKPSASSKSKDHVECLTRRLILWHEGKLSDLLREGKTIQSRLTKSKSGPSPLVIFSRLMLKGQVSAALKWVKRNPSLLLSANGSVLDELQSKHPDPKPADDDCIYVGPIEVPDPILFNCIDANLVRRAAKLTRGSAGPSGIDSESWGRILVSKHFKSAGTDLCASFAKFIRVLATEEVNPVHIAEFLSSRVVALDKKPGVRPIGIGETLRRIAGKCISLSLKTEVTEATAPLQTCGGLEGGVESSVHAVRDMYMDDTTDCVLLVDAANAFNCLNRSAALQNVGALCPPLYQYLKNLYGSPTEMVVNGTKEKLVSAEGTTQGCNLAMDFYGIGIMKLIHMLKELHPECRTSWYADDSAGAGSAGAVKAWWDALQDFGPKMGYFPQPEKTVLIIKDTSKQDYFKSLFPGIKVTAEGHRYLGSFIGTKSATESYVATKVKEWVQDIEDISRAASSEPQLAYAGFYYGTSKKWNYLLRTTPDIANLLEPVERAIVDLLLPALTGITPVTETLRDTFALSPKNGGLGIVNPATVADSEYRFSTIINRELVTAILENRGEEFIPDSQVTLKAKRECKAAKTKMEEDRKFHLLSTCSTSLKRQITLLSEKGASAWLSTLPLKNCGFVLSKQQFQDGLRLRYNIPLEGVSLECACGKPNSIDHALICKLGGYTHLRHNHLRDTLSNLLDVVCKDVVKEPHLLPVTNEDLPRGTTLKQDARLDISCRGFFSALDKTFIDVRVLHPNSQSNAEKPLLSMYRCHEEEKKTKYLHRIIQVEKANFSPFVVSTTGGIAPEATAFLKMLGQKLSTKLNQSYPNIMGYLRRKLRFELLKTTLMAVRGFRKNKTVHITDLDLNLMENYIP